MAVGDYFSAESVACRGCRVSSADVALGVFRRGLMATATYSFEDPWFVPHGQERGAFDEIPIGPGRIA
jgi:hypothetical protein